MQHQYTVAAFVHIRENKQGEETADEHMIHVQCRT